MENTCITASFHWEGVGEWVVEYLYGGVDFDSVSVIVRLNMALS